MAEFFRLLLYLLGGYAVVIAVIVCSAAPAPWGRILALLATAAAILVWYRVDRPHEIRAARLARGQCLACGYDLTGNESGVCPECGRGEDRMALEPDPILDIAQEMMTGRRPTEPRFMCPSCGNQARLSASPVGTKWVQVAVHCDCGEGLELDGGARWPGCEILFPPEFR